MNKEYDVDKVRSVFLQDLKDNFFECYSRLKTRSIVIYGAGGYGKMMVNEFIDIGMGDNIIAICDSNSEKWGNRIGGIEICGINNVDFERNPIIIIASQFEDEIRDSLKEYSFEIFDKPPYQKFVEEKLNMYVWNTTQVCTMGFRIEWFKEYNEKLVDKEEQIIPMLEDEKSKNIILNRVNFYTTGKVEYLKKIPVDGGEYFDKEYFQLSDSEIYVDCGAYTGDTIVDFIDKVINFKEIYAFEPDVLNFEKLGERIKNIKHSNNIHIFQYAVGEKEGKLSFASKSTEGSCICEDGESEVQVKKIDDVILDKVSFIKMDIEGAELSALRGAERIIKQFKPKLAICVYHKCEDIFDIPLYLHKLVPEYRFKIRQHRDDLYDTVLYATI